MAGCLSDAAGQIELPEPDLAAPVIVSAEFGSSWRQGVYEVWVLRGNCRIRQGTDTATSHEAVLWIDRTDTVEKGRGKVIAYLEGDVAIDFNRRPRTEPADRQDAGWAGSTPTRRSRSACGDAGGTGHRSPKPAIYERGMPASQDETSDWHRESARSSSSSPKPVPAPPRRQSRRRARGGSASSPQQRAGPDPSGTATRNEPVDRRSSPRA